jgi:hypothetical protein
MTLWGIAGKRRAWCEEVVESTVESAAILLANRTLTRDSLFHRLCVETGL